MKEIYVVIDKGAFGRVSILDKETFIKFKNEDSFQCNAVLICSVEKSFVIESGILKESKYKFELVP